MNTATDHRSHVAAAAFLLRWAAVATLLLSVPAVATPPDTLEAQDLVGIWKMCFEPGLEDLYEPSEGYLAILPNGTYLEIRLDCCHRNPRSESNTYRVEGNSVVFNNVRVDGSEYSISRELVRSVSAVPFDDLRGEPVVADALKVGKTLDYAYCRLYPSPDDDQSTTSM
jgi:hypothetical protein